MFYIVVTEPKYISERVTIQFQGVINGFLLEIIQCPRRLSKSNNTVGEFDWSGIGTCRVTVKGHETHAI